MWVRYFIYITYTAYQYSVQCAHYKMFSCFSYSFIHVKRSNEFQHFIKWSLLWVHDKITQGNKVQHKIGINVLAYECVLSSWREISRFKFHQTEEKYTTWKETKYQQHFATTLCLIFAQNSSFYIVVKLKPIHINILQWNLNCILFAPEYSICTVEPLVHHHCLHQHYSDTSASLS